MGFALFCPSLPYSPHLAALLRLLIAFIRLMCIGPGVRRNSGTGLILMTLIQALESRREALTVQEVADLLGVSDKHIYEMIADGRLPAFRVGRSVRIDPPHIADWPGAKRPSATTTGN